MTGGEAIVDALLAHGVDTVFGLPGVQTYAIFDAMARASNRLRVVSARHEQACAYMAHGAATSTGKPAVFCVVPGPGVLNATAALATAAGVGAQVLCVTGQIPSADIGRGRGHLHELPDQLASLRGLVKWADRIEQPAAAPLAVARAFQEMRSGRPGPVALEMPWDQLAATGEVTAMAPLAPFAPPTPDPRAVDRAAALIAAARRPMIMVGGGARAAGPAVLALARRIGAPVVSFRGGRGVVSDADPLGLTVAAGWRLWAETDLLIGIGSRLEVPCMRWRGIPAGTRTVRIDIDPAEARRLRPDAFVLADASAGADALAAAAGAPSDTADRQARVAAAREAAERDIQRIQPHMTTLRTLRAALPEDAFIVDEVCQAGFVSIFGLPIHMPRRYVSSGFQGTLGAGFMTALGVKVANPGTPVVSLTGDGGFLFGASELATAMQHRIPLVTLLFNNGAYGNVLRDQRRLFDGRDCGSRLVNPDFMKLADAYGVPAWRVTEPGQLRPALDAALACDLPTLIELPSDIAEEASPWEILSPGRA